MLTTFKYRLYPSKKQVALMDETIETCRHWYNLCLGERKNAWETERRNIGKFDQLAKVKDYRKENAYAFRVHSHIMQGVVADLDKAFQAFFFAGSRSGKRQDTQDLKENTVSIVSA